jgi:glycosyltransferase involved in cell wall biosynthesis
MRILMVNATYGGVSGSGRAVKLLSNELVRRGLEVGLLTNETSGYLEVPKLKSISFTLLAKLREKKNYEVIHVHNPKFSLAIERQSNNVLTIHGDFLTEMQYLYGKITSHIVEKWYARELSKFRCVTCVSPYWSKLRGWKYVPNGLDLEEIAKIPPLSEQFVLFVGRKSKVKGYDLFEKAMKRTRLKYRVLGAREPVPWKQVISFMKSAHCLVLPTFQEGMPYVILEAFASGCPVIATDLPALRSFGEGAILFLEKLDVASVKAAIEELMEDQSLLDRLRIKGLEKAKEYDIRKVAGEYISIYEEVRRSHGELSDWHEAGTLNRVQTRTRGGFD